MTDEERADSGEWASVDALIAEARETFTRMVAEDRPFDDAFNGATQALVAELGLARDFADARRTLLALERAKASEVQSFAARMIADAILELCAFEEKAQQARSDLSRCSRRLALMLAPLFPSDGILASLTVSHDSAVARINHLVQCEAALRDVARSYHTCEVRFLGTPEDMRAAHEALDNARKLIQPPDSAQ